MEIASAICRRYRTGLLTEALRDAVLEALRADCEDLHLVELRGSVAIRSTLLLSRHDLRAGDAIQLASCLELRDRFQRQVPFVVWDEHLRAAAAAEGLLLLPSEI